MRRSSRVEPEAWKMWIGRLIASVAVMLVVYAVIRAGIMLAGLDRSEYREILVGAGATFLRVLVALAIGSLWTIPAGVAIGFSPRLARIAQPLAQIAASVPATALFPIVLLLLIRIGGGLGLGSIVLLLLGTQWYILFNVIAGAMAIPTDLKEASTLFRFGSAQRWRQLILPGIFPYLVTGLVTASGGAWNASIVAEYFRFKDQTYTTVGLGAVISRATDAGNFALLLGINRDHGAGRSHHQSPGVASHVSTGRRALYAGDVAAVLGCRGGRRCALRLRPRNFGQEQPHRRAV